MSLSDCYCLKLIRYKNFILSDVIFTELTRKRYRKFPKKSRGIYTIPDVNTEKLKSGISALVFVCYAG